jgi:hypothetical protein
VTAPATSAVLPGRPFLASAYCLRDADRRAGRALIDRSVDESLTYEDGLLAVFTESQREELASLLKILLASLSGR